MPQESLKLPEIPLSFNSACLVRLVQGIYNLEGAKENCGEHRTLLVECL
jgi:hypothetical protein